MKLNRAFTLVLGTAAVANLTAGFPLLAQETMEPPGILVPSEEEDPELPDEVAPADEPVDEATLEGSETDEMVEEPGAEALILEEGEAEPELTEESEDFDFDVETGAEVDGAQNVIESIEAPE
jgi:hypothetical protein